MMAGTTDARFVTRRARACGVLANPGDYSDKTGAPDKLGRVTIVCTLVDIGDPRFRLWLHSIANRRCLPAAPFALEIFDGQTQAQEKDPSSA